MIKGLATPESGRCDGRLNRTPNPVSIRKHDRGGGDVRIVTCERARSILSKLVRSVTSVSVISINGH
jgi:hypothetical protein